MSENRIVRDLHNKLVDAQLYAFPVRGKIFVSESQGVYIISDGEGRALHVGSTKYGKGGLNQRLYNHISKTGVLYNEFLKPNGINLRDGYFFRFIELEDARKRALVEALTAGLLCPEHIGTGVKRD
ncbi:MAG: hypothetical protein KDC56_05745 [Flavobacteriaceae bacterium]|nr:hypothetical protein [Flavobacteriaceae bacterium]